MGRATPIPQGQDPSRDWRDYNRLQQDVAALERLAGTLQNQIIGLRLERGWLSKGGGGGDTFKGEYNGGVTYAVGDTVKLSFGAGAGLYRKMSSGTGSPTDGVTWAQLSTVLDQSNWV